VKRTEYPVASEARVGSDRTMSVAADLVAAVVVADDGDGRIRLRVGTVERSRVHPPIVAGSVWVQQMVCFDCFHDLGENPGDISRG
jgi:hypothetical protein